MCSVCTEQGSSASQMTAAKGLDIISRLPGCAGQAADAVSACTQVKMEDAPSLLKIPKSECPDIWIRLPHKWPKLWSNIEDPVVLLERDSNGHSHAGLLWERPFGESSIGTRKGEYRIGSASLFTENKDCFLSAYVDDIKMTGRKQNMGPMWKKLMKLVDLGEPTSFLDHVYLGMHSTWVRIERTYY